MYTVYDFINCDIESKRMRLGWKIEAAGGRVVLRYTVLNFDWKSLDCLGGEAWNLFLASASYSRMRLKLANAMKKLKRLRFDANSVADLKELVAEAGLKIDVDGLLAKAISRKSAAIKAEREKAGCRKPADAVQ